MSKEEDSEIVISGKAEIIDPPNHLKEKAGSGGIPKHCIEKAESFLQDNDIDFLPFAHQHLKDIENSLKKLKETQNPEKQKHHLSTIIEDIMHIKAHGGMFKCGIMSKISAITLTFLEDVEDIHEDIFQIINAHNDSIKLITKLGIKDDGGTQGTALIKELTNATLRYQKKHSNTK